MKVKKTQIKIDAFRTEINLLYIYEKTKIF